jgi:hypothetical protein
MCFCCSNACELQCSRNFCCDSSAISPWFPCAPPNETSNYAKIKGGASPVKFFKKLYQKFWKKDQENFGQEKNTQPILIFKLVINLQKVGKY